MKISRSAALRPRGAISLLLLFVFHLPFLLGNLCIIAANGHRTVTVTVNLNLSDNTGNYNGSSGTFPKEFVSSRLSRSSVPLFIGSIHTNSSNGSSSSSSNVGEQIVVGGLFSNATGTLLGAILSSDEWGNTTADIGVNLSLSIASLRGFSPTITANGSALNGVHECDLRSGASTFQEQPYTSLLLIAPSAAVGNETATDVCLLAHEFDAFLEGQLLNRSSSADPLLGSFPIAAMRNSSNISGYGLATANVSRASIDGLVPVSAVRNDLDFASSNSIYDAAVASPLAMFVDGARLFGQTAKEESRVLFDAMGESTVHVVGRISRSSRGFLAAEVSRSFISRGDEEVSGSATDVSASLPVLDLVEAMLQGSERLSSPFRPLETVGYHSVVLKPTEEGEEQGARYLNVSSSGTSASGGLVVAAAAEVAVAPLHLLLGSFNVGVYVDGPSAVLALAFARREGDGDAGGGRKGDEQINTIDANNTRNKYRLEVFVHSIEQLLVEMDTHASFSAAAAAADSPFPLPLVALSFITQRTHTRNIRRYLAINGERLSPVSDAEVLGMCGRRPFSATLPSAALQELVRRFVVPVSATGQLKIALSHSVVELTDEKGRVLPSSGVAVRDVDDLSSFMSPLHPSLVNLTAGTTTTVVSFAFLSGAPLSPQATAELVPQYPFHASVGTHTHKALFALCVLFLLAIIVGIVAAFACESEALAAWSCARLSSWWTERGNVSSSRLCPKCAAAGVVNKNSVSESAEASATASVAAYRSSLDAPRRGLWGFGRPNIPLQCRGPRDRTERVRKGPFFSSSSFADPDRQSKPYTCQQCGVLQEEQTKRPKETPQVRDAFAAETYWSKNKPFLPLRLGAVVTLALVMLWSWQVQAVFYLTIWPDSSTEDASIRLESTRQQFEEFALWAQYAALAFFPIPTSYATPLQIVTFNLWAILAASFMCCCAMWAMMWMDLRTTSTRMCLSYVHSLTAKEYFVQRLVDLKLFDNGNPQPPHQQQHYSSPPPTSSVPKEIQQSRPLALLTNMQADMEGELARLEQGRDSFQQRVVDTFLPEGFVGNNAFILDLSTVVDVCRDTSEGGEVGSSEHHQRRIAGREASSRQELLSAISIALAFEKQARLRARRYKRFMATAKKILEANESETEADANSGKDKGAASVMSKGSSSPPLMRAASAPSVRRHESSGLADQRSAPSTSSKGPRRQRGTSFNAGHSLSPERLINSQMKGSSAGSRLPPPPSEALIGESNLNGVGLATHAHLRHATTGRVYECVVRGVYRRNFRPTALLMNDLSTRKTDDSTSSSEDDGDDNAHFGAEDSLTPDQFNAQQPLFVPGGATSPVAVAAIRRRAAPRLWVFIEVLHLHQKALAVFRADLSVFDMPFEKKPRPILRSPSRVMTSSYASEAKAMRGNASVSPRSTAATAISTTKGLLDAITASTHFIDAAYFTGNVITPVLKNNKRKRYNGTMRGDVKESTLTSNGSRGRRVIKVLFGSFVTLVTAWLIIPSLWWSVHILFSSTGKDRQSVHDNVLTCTWVTEVRYRPLMVAAATSMLVLWVSFFVSILFWAIIRRNIMRKWDDDGFELGQFDHNPYHQNEGSSGRYLHHGPSAGGGDDPLLQSISTGIRPSFACNGNETMYVAAAAAGRKSGADAALSDPALEMRAVSQEPNYNAWYGTNKKGRGGKGKAMTKSDEAAAHPSSTVAAAAPPEVHKHSLVSKVNTLLRIFKPEAESVVNVDRDEEMATEANQRQAEPDDLVVESVSVSPLNPNAANIRNFFACAQSPTENKTEKDCWNGSDSPSADRPLPANPNNFVTEGQICRREDATWWATGGFTSASLPPPPPRRRMLNQKDLTDLCDILSAFYRVSTPPLQSALRGTEVGFGEQQQIELAVVDQREVMNAAVGATTAAALLGNGLSRNCHGTQESVPSTVFAGAAPSSLPPKRSRQSTEAAESTAATISASTDPLSREEGKDGFRGDFSSASASTIPLTSPPPPPPLISPVDVILAYGSALNDGREGSPAVLNLSPAPNPNCQGRSMSVTLENASFGGESNSAFTPQTTSMPFGGHAGARFPLRNVILFGAGPPAGAGAGAAISPRNPHLFVPSSTSRRPSRGGGGFHYASPLLYPSVASSSMTGHDLHHRRRAEEPPPNHDEVAGARLLFSPKNDGDVMNNSNSHSQRRFGSPDDSSAVAGGDAMKMTSRRRRSDTVGPTTTTPLSFSAASESAEDSGRGYSPIGVFSRQNDTAALHVARERAPHRRASAVVFAPIPTEPLASSSTHFGAGGKNIPALERTAGPRDALSASSIRSGGKQHDDVNSEHAYGVISQSGSIVERSDLQNSSSTQKGETVVIDKNGSAARLLSLALSPADLSATSVADSSVMAHHPPRHTTIPYNNQYSMPPSPTCKEGSSPLPLYVSAASGAHVLRPLLVVLPSVTHVLFSVMEAGRQGLSFDDSELNSGGGGDDIDEEIAGYMGPANAVGSSTVGAAAAALAFNARFTSVSMLDKLCSATITINLLPVTALEVAGEGGGIRVPGGGGGHPHQQREAALNAVAAAVATGGGDSTAHLQNAAQYNMIKSLLDSSGLANSPYRSAREALINSGAAGAVGGGGILNSGDKDKAPRSGPEEDREKKLSPIARQKRLALQLLKIGVTENENQIQNPASSGNDNSTKSNNNTLSVDPLPKRSVIVISPLTKRLHVLGAAATATPSENTRNDNKDAHKSSAQNASPLSPVQAFGFSPSSSSSSSSSSTEEEELSGSSDAENSNAKKRKDRKQLHAGVISILANVDGSSSDNAESEAVRKHGGAAVQVSSVVRDTRDGAAVDAGGAGASTSNPLFPPSFARNDKATTSEAQQKQRNTANNHLRSRSEGIVSFEHSRPQTPETEDGCGAAREMDSSPAKASTDDNQAKKAQGNSSSPPEASPTSSHLLPLLYLRRVQPEALDRPLFEHYCHVLLSLPGISLPVLSWFLIASFVSICLSVMLPSVGLYAHRWLSGPHRFESNLKLETTPNGADIDDVSSLTLTLGINALLQYTFLSIAVWRKFVCRSADDATRSDLSSLPSSKRATIVAKKGRLIIITYTSIAAFGFAQCLNLLLGLETARRRAGGAVSTIIGLDLLSYEASAGVCWCITGFVFVLLMVLSVVR